MVRIINFKKWLFEVGSTGGVGGGLTPPKENPLMTANALSDYHDEKSSDSKNPNGLLPPIKNNKKIINKQKWKKL